MEMIICFRKFSNFSDFFYLFFTFLFNNYICKIFFLNKKIVIHFFVKSVRYYTELNSENFGMEPIVFNFPQNFEP